MSETGRVAAEEDVHPRSSELPEAAEMKLGINPSVQSQHRTLSSREHLKVTQRRHGAAPRGVAVALRPMLSRMPLSSAVTNTLPLIGAFTTPQRAPRRTERSRGESASRGAARR